MPSGVAGGRRNGGDDGLEERLQIHAGSGRIEGRRARLGHRVKHGKIQLRLVRIEVDEEVVDLVQDFLRARVGAVDFVDDHDGLELGLQSLGQHVARLRQRPLGGVHEQHDAVHHLQGALHLAAKIGVARRVHDVDFAALEDDGGVFGQDGDAPLPLQLVGVHHPVGHLLVGAEGAGLPQHGVHESRLAVVNMGNDGDIAYRLGHRGAFPSFGSANGPWGWGTEIETIAAHCGSIHCISRAKKGWLR